MNSIHDTGAIAVMNPGNPTQKIPPMTNSNNPNFGGGAVVLGSELVMFSGLKWNETGQVTSRRDVRELSVEKGYGHPYNGSAVSSSLPVTDTWPVTGEMTLRRAQREK